MTLTIYRVTNAGDNLGNVPAIEQIAYNSTADIENHNGFITEYHITNTTGIGNNQAAEQDLGDHQDLGPVEQLYILTGFISIRDQVVASTNLVTIMNKWDVDPKTNDDFVHGRFGIDIDDFPVYDIIPDGVGADQVGLILKSIEWGPLDYDRLPLRADFKMTFLVDKGDDQ